jgi:hypothetical protein
MAGANPLNVKFKEGEFMKRAFIVALISLSAQAGAELYQIPDGNIIEADKAPQGGTPLRAEDIDIYYLSSKPTKSAKDPQPFTVTRIINRLYDGNRRVVGYEVAADDPSGRFIPIEKFNWTPMNLDGVNYLVRSSFLSDKTIIDPTKETMKHELIEAKKFRSFGGMAKLVAAFQFRRSFPNSKLAKEYSPELIKETSGDPRADEVTDLLRNPPGSKKVKAAVRSNIIDDVVRQAVREGARRE